MEDMCKCAHHKVVPMCITLIGLVLFAGQVSWLSAGFVAALWPVLLVIIGLTKLMGPGCKCC